MSTTSLEEIKGNIQELARAIQRSGELRIRVSVYQEQSTALRRAGMYQDVMSFDKFIEHRQAYVVRYGLQNTPLNSMDVAYMNAETGAHQYRWHLLQSLLHEIDKLAIVMGQVTRSAAVQTLVTVPLAAEPAPLAPMPDEPEEPDVPLADQVEEVEPDVPEEPSEPAGKGMSVPDDEPEDAEDEADM